MAAPTQIFVTPVANGFSVAVPAAATLTPLLAPPTTYVFPTWTLLTAWITAQGWTIS